MQDEIIDPNKTYIKVGFNGTVYEMEVSDFHKSLYSVMADFKRQVAGKVNLSFVTDVEKYKKELKKNVIDVDLRDTAEAGDPIDFYFVKHNEHGEDFTLYPEKNGIERSLNDYGVNPNDDLYIITEGIAG